MRVIAVLAGAAGGALIAKGDWFLGIWYFALSITYALNGASYGAAYERGRQAGRREARVELWASFHEAVIIRRMHPAQWLSAEADRDVPRIALVVAEPMEDE